MTATIQLQAQSELNAYVESQAQAIAPETKLPTSQLRKGDLIQNFSGTWKVLTTPKPAPGGLEFQIEWVHLPANHSPQTVRFAPDWRFGYLGRAA
ncbi:MAG TPA: hypothetical protein V6C57_27410 [Coleofasciculaceae cyanobacterium]